MATAEQIDEQIVANIIEHVGATGAMVARVESTADALDRLIGELAGVRSYAAGVYSQDYAYRKLSDQHNRLLEAREILQKFKDILQ